MLPHIACYHAIIFQKSYLNVSQNSEKICECSKGMCLQSVERSNQNLEHTLRNKKDKFSMNSATKKTKARMKIFTYGFCPFCFPMCISNF